MKKIIVTLLALMLALLSLAALAEEDATIPSPEADDLADIAELSGFVMDVQDEFILVKTPDGLYVEAFVTPETALDGKEAAIGDYIHIVYNGMMTRSLPAQITAQHIRNCLLAGVVTEITEEGFTLVTDADEYIVHATAEQLAGIQSGMTVTVYFNGVMTMSLPPQVSADHIRGQEIAGIVTEMTENGFLLSVEGIEAPYDVHVKEDALLFVQAEPGMEVRIVTDGVMAPSLDAPILNATEVLPVEPVQELFDIAGAIAEITDEYVLIETGEGQLIQVNISAQTLYEGKDIAVGDLVHVTYNGQMTFSLPAQIAALKIGCYTHTGVVSDLSETGFILTTELEPIVVNILPEMAAAIKDGDTVTVYTNGVMTMSLPAQVAAEMITVTQTIVD